jgi:hypothetical protein
MKRNFMRTILFFLVAHFCILGVYGGNKNQDLLTRPVVVSQEGKQIHCRVLIEKMEMEPELKATYFWYHYNQILSNRGGYSGVLLHGEYRVYDGDSRLVEQGQFDRGKKQGEWKYWNQQGELVRTVDWKNGVQEGLDCKYSGLSIWDKTKYKSDRMHGRRTLQTADSLIVEVYRNGDLRSRQAKSLIKPEKKKKEKTEKKEKSEKREKKKEKIEKKEKREKREKKKKTKRKNRKEKVAETKIDGNES